MLCDLLSFKSFYGPITRLYRLICNLRYQMGELVDLGPYTILACTTQLKSSTTFLYSCLSYSTDVSSPKGVFLFIMNRESES